MTAPQPESYADLEARNSQGQPFQIQSYPHICDVATRMALDNDCINRDESTADFYEKTESVIGDTGVYHEDLQALDDWLATLNSGEKDLLAGGEQEEMLALIAKGPTGGPDDIPLANIFNDMFEVM